MSDIGDYLQKRAGEMGLDRADQLAEIQTYLDGLYPGQCRAVSLHDGVLKITTHNASLASELRMRQREMLQAPPLQSVARLILQVG